MVSKAADTLSQIGDGVGKVINQVLRHDNPITPIVTEFTKIVGGGSKTVATVTEAVDNQVVQNTEKVSRAVMKPVVTTGLTVTGMSLSGLNQLLLATGVSSVIAKLLNASYKLFFAERYGQYAVPNLLLLQFRLN